MAVTRVFIIILSIVLQAQNVSHKKQIVALENNFAVPEKVIHRVTV